MDDTNNDGSTPVTLDQALDQIQNWINTGNTQMASEGLKEVLEMDPANQRALDLQTQMNGSTSAAVEQNNMQPPAPMMNDDIQIGGAPSEAAATPIQTAPVTDSMPEMSMNQGEVAQSAPSTSINLGDLDTTATGTAPAAPSDPFSVTPSMPENSPQPDTGAGLTFDIPTQTTEAVEAPVAPTPDTSIPTEANVTAPTFEVPSPTPENSSGVSFEIPSTPPSTGPVDFGPATPTEVAENTAPEVPISPFTNTESSDQNMDFAATTSPSEAMPQDTVMPSATLNSSDKKAILIKALIPLGIALILGFVVYFSYGRFFSDDTPTNTTVTNDIVTQPTDTISNNETTPVDATDNKTTDTTATSDTTDTANGILKPEDTTTSTVDTTSKTDTSSTVSTDTKVKVKRPVKKVQ